MGGVVFVFFAGNESLKTQISKKIQKLKYLVEKQENKKQALVKGSAGAHSTRVQNFRVHLSKTAWTLDSEEFGVLRLNQPVLLFNMFSGKTRRHNRCACSPHHHASFVANVPTLLPTMTRQSRRLLVESAAFLSSRSHTLSAFSKLDLLVTS